MAIMEPPATNKRIEDSYQRRAAAATINDNAHPASTLITRRDAAAFAALTGLLASAAPTRDIEKKAVAVADRLLAVLDATNGSETT
jgi:hypothetical protein